MDPGEERALSVPSPWRVGAEGETADKSGHAPQSAPGDPRSCPAEESGSDTLFLVKMTLENARVSLPGWRWGHAWDWELH